MERVLVLGCCGAGKSTFARELGRRAGLPVVHLDQLYWRPGWVEPPDDEWASALDDVLAEDRWIIDGNYATTLPQRLARADTVAVLGLSRAVCMRSVLTRVITGYGRTRPDSAPGCPERLDFEFLAYVWSFHRQHMPTVQSAVERFREAGGRVEVARTRREANALLDVLASPAPD